MGLLLAILGLSFIVFIHELGHAVLAVIFGVNVKVFSIGIGNIYFSFKLKRTEVRISPLLLGGYCQMEGTSLIDHKTQRTLKYEDLPGGSFLRASRWKRILIYLGGPVFNIFLAFFIFSYTNAVGISRPDYSTKIVVKDVPESLLQSGDSISRIEDKVVYYFTDILKDLPQEMKSVSFEVERAGETRKIALNTSLYLFSKSIFPWIPLKVGKVKKDSPAKLAGIKKGDVIISLDGKNIYNYYELENLKKQKTSGTFQIKIQRDKEILELTLYSAMPTWGIFFDAPKVKLQKSEDLVTSFKEGLSQVTNFLRDSFIDIWSLVLNPASLLTNISGPVGITNHLASASGFVSWVQFLGIISASLAAMNLFFPISILDGGQIFILLIESIRRKEFQPKTLFYIHILGVLFVLILFFLGFFNDISFLLGNKTS